MGESLQSKVISLAMLAKRLLVSVILLPIGLAVIVWGGPVYAVFIALIMFLAAREYWQLFRAGGLQPAGFLILGGTVLFVLSRAIDDFESAPWITSLLVLASMGYHLWAYERGRDQAATDLGVTLAGALYLGWIGAYFISLRNLPEGMWWVLLALPSVWLADSAAYLVGSRFGRHKLSPRLSPKKTWEGYLGGVAAGILGGALLATIWRTGAGPATAIAPWKGAVLGFILATVTPLGDLGESMIKRQVGVKDSGNLLPGHGGVFDRIDSWLWTAVLSYYAILWFFLS
jgi:phosphatidate cytidylyltransferase